MNTEGKPEPIEKRSQNDSRKEVRSTREKKPE
jgi:hypothetical protein